MKKITWMKFKQADRRPRLYVCETCKVRFKLNPRFVEACIWYGEQGRPPFTKADLNVPEETRYLSENRAILAVIVYCEKCLK